MANRFGRRTADWMRFRLGDRVRDVNDERFEGTVEAIKWSHLVKVKWDNGWISEIPLNDLEKVR